MAFEFDLNPNSLLRKAVLAFTSREAETSETPEFGELKTRRYRAPLREVYDAAIQVASRWFGWRIISREKNLGSVASIKCDIISVALGGNHLELSVSLVEEVETNGETVTIVNAKSVADVPTKGDLGENRRWIGLFLSNLDEEVIQTASPVKAASVSEVKPAASEAPAKPKLVIQIQRNGVTSKPSNAVETKPTEPKPSTLQQPTTPSMKLILFGTPGVGKGTQAKALAQKYSVAHLSTGDMLRAAIEQKSKLGMEAKAFMDKGELVPDAVIIGMIEETLASPKAQAGFVLDGFPRTVAQAEALDEMLSRRHLALDKIINITVAEEDVVKRLSGRLTCPNCGAIYNKFFQPTRVANTCDKCGHVGLTQRDDDKEETVRHRLTVYHKSTEPVLNYYRTKKGVVNVDGAKAVDDVTRSIESALV
jgi:adenylate kinase